jgi:peptide subunit release factor 1 (eRF1)
MLVSTALDHDASSGEIIAAAQQAASELRAARGLALVDQLVEHAGGHARAAVGVPAIQRALRARAVDLLLLTPRFTAGHESEAEDFVRAAIASGADVEVPSGEAAARLDRAGDGIAARLRFAIDEAPAIADGTRG